MLDGCLGAPISSDTATAHFPHRTKAAQLFSARTHTQVQIHHMTLSQKRDWKTLNKIARLKGMSESKLSEDLFAFRCALC